jgi:hypothetical protein
LDVDVNSSKSQANEPRPDKVIGLGVEVVFKATPIGSTVRALITEADLSAAGLKGEKGGKRMLLQQETEVKCFALMMLEQIRQCLSSNMKWKDPLSGRHRPD